MNSVYEDHRRILERERERVWLCDEGKECEEGRRREKRGDE